MKHYKIASIAAFLVFLCATGTYAAETGEINTGDTNDTGHYTQQMELNHEGINDMNKTMMAFCNDGLTQKDLKVQSLLIARPGEVKDFCVMFLNETDTGIIFYPQFSEGVKNEQGIIACRDNGKDNAFSKLVREDFASMKLWIEPHTQLYRSFHLNVPIKATGDIYGCIAYYINGWYTQQGWSVFGMLVRRVAPITINIIGKPYHLWRRQDFKDIYKTNQSSILKVIAWIIVLRIIISIFNSGKKKEEKHHHKK